MGIKSDHQITSLVKEFGMIDPFLDHLVRTVDDQKVVSYGLSSMGYDLRVGNEFKVAQEGLAPNTIFDVKNPDSRLFKDVYVPDHEAIVIPPHGFVLMRSVERFHIPAHIIVIATGKSTYCRAGILFNCSPLEPEWEGYLTVEIASHCPFGVKLYAGEGIGQLLFFEGDAPPQYTYATRPGGSGKYQNQEAQPTISRM